MPRYNWPIPGEGATAMELAATEIRTAIPGLAMYSHAAKQDAILAELAAALYNGTPVASLAVTAPVLTRLTVANALLSSVANASVTPDLSAASFFSVAVLTPGAYSINNPTNSLGTAGQSQLVAVQIANQSGGSITTTFGGNFRLAGAWTDPANNKTRLIVFVQLNTAFLEIARSAADIS